MNLRHALQSNGNGKSSVSSTSSLQALCESAQIKDMVLKECNSIGKKTGFKQQELLMAVILTPDEWTPESGLVTAAQKIQRVAIAKKFSEEIKVSFFSFFLNIFWPN